MSTEIYDPSEATPSEASGVRMDAPAGNNETDHSKPDATSAVGSLCSTTSDTRAANTTDSSSAAARVPSNMQLVVRLEFHQRNYGTEVLSNLKDFPCQLALHELYADGRKGPSELPVNFQMEVLLHSATGDHRPLRQLRSVESHPPLLLLCGETDVNVIGEKTLNLRLGRGVTSFLYREQKSRGEKEVLFSLRVTPTDAAVAAAHPSLTVITHPFKVVTKLKAPPAHVAACQPPVAMPLAASSGGSSMGFSTGAFPAVMAAPFPHSFSVPLVSGPLVSGHIADRRTAQQLPPAGHQSYCYCPAAAPAHAPAQHAPAQRNYYPAAAPTHAPAQRNPNLNDHSRKRPQPEAE